MTRCPTSVLANYGYRRNGLGGFGTAVLFGSCCSLPLASICKGSVSTISSCINTCTNAYLILSLGFLTDGSVELPF